MEQVKAKSDFEIASLEDIEKYELVRAMYFHLTVRDLRAIADVYGVHLGENMKAL